MPHPPRAAGSAAHAIDPRLLRRRFLGAAAALLLPLLAATGASVVFHHHAADQLRYVVALSQLSEAMARLDVQMAEIGAGLRPEPDVVRATFVKALTHHGALRAADPDGGAILEDAGGDERRELGRLLERHGVDPVAAGRAMGLIGHAMPEALEAVWEEEDWEGAEGGGPSLEEAFGARLLAAAPLVEAGEALPEPGAALRGYWAAAAALSDRELAEVAEVLQREARASAEAPVLLALAVMGAAVAAVALAYLAVFRPLARHIVRVQRALEREAHAARAADRAKSEFLATMSHEIRTPMNGVLGMAQLLEGTALDARQRTLADVILQSGRQLLRVINDILDVSKIDAGRLALEPRPFKLSRIATEPARLVAHLAEEKGLALAVRVDPALPRCVVGDPDRLQQVVTNLLGNAVKFTEAGQVYLNLAAVGGPAEGPAEGSRARCRLRVEVEDTGPGIPEDRRAHVFERFTQIDGGSTRRHEGTGLGLAICKGLVEAMGGRIGVEDAELRAPGIARARGATFWFEVDLPVAEAEPGEAARPRARPVHAAGRRVLSVDDHETNRFIVRELLQSWGLAEASAASGREALQCLANAARRGEPFDAVILDHHMPSLSGPQVIEAMRRDPALAGTAVVLLSSVEDDGGGAGASEADARLMKPAAPSALFDALMAALARAAGRAAPEGLAPPAPPPPGADVPPEAPAEPAGGVVLLVEDNRFNRVVVGQILAGAGVEIVEARDGAEALVLAAARRPDLILMDVSMPGMDGLEATRRLRAREREEGRPRTPILGLTAHALPLDRARCLEAGMDDHLPKPLDVTRLREAVAKAVGRRAAAA